MIVRKNLLSLVLLFNLLLDTGCLGWGSREVTPAPRHAWVTRWLENPACCPPCWEGITPGVTTITEAVYILNHLAGVSKVEDTHGILTGIAYRWYFDQQGGEGMLTENEQGRVAGVELGVAYEQLLTIGEVISTYGSPSHVQRGGLHMGQSGLYIIYMERGMVLYSILTIYDGSVKVSPKTRVLELDFIQPGEDSFIQYSRDFNKIVEWQGYTSYSVR